MKKYQLVPILTAAVGMYLVGCADDNSMTPSHSQHSVVDATSTELVVAVELSTSHPYTNNLDQTYVLDVDALVEHGHVGSCVNRVRAHFSRNRFERNYDFLYVTGGLTEQMYRFTGTNDDSWTEWIPVGEAANTRRIDFRIDTDYSVIDYGFDVDALQWQGAPLCAAIAYPACADGTIDMSPPLAACDCPSAPVCVPVEEIAVSHGIRRGFFYEGNRLVGTQAYTVRPGPVDEPVDTLVGEIEPDSLRTLVNRARTLGLLATSGYRLQPAAGEITEWFSIDAGGQEIRFSAGQGQHTAAVRALIDEFLALFTCGETSPLSCAAGDGYSCQAGQCVQDVGCACPKIYLPVCGDDGNTYGNTCEAVCANVGVAHENQCGVAGDVCGGMDARMCEADYKCRFGEGQYSLPHPDASGLCVEQFYCDAEADCSGLPHIAVPGSWACASNQCSWTML